MDDKAPSFVTIVLGLLAAAALGGTVALYGSGSKADVDAKRWGKLVVVQPTSGFDAMLEPKLIEDGIPPESINWGAPHVAVYSVPTLAPPRPPGPTLRDLAESGQAHAIDFLGQNHVWDDLRKTLINNTDADEGARDPYRFDRVLVSTVTRGTNWEPGDRMIWTRVFIEPINFEFAGFTVAATENETVKVTSVEASMSRKLSAEVEAGVEGAKVTAGPSQERTVTSKTDIAAAYEKLGIDIRPEFLRIIRESERGGDVLGNTTVSLSVLTDPEKINRRYPGEKSVGVKDDNVSLVVSKTFLQDASGKDAGDKARLEYAPQLLLPHCSLRARVWMLYGQRNIVGGREFYSESDQTVRIIRDYDKPRDVEIVRADDVAPAVWSLRIVENDDGPRSTSKKEARFIHAGIPRSVNGKLELQPADLRNLVFTDFGLASNVAHWLRTKSKSPSIMALMLDYPGGVSVVPSKVHEDACMIQPTAQKEAGTGRSGDKVGVSQ
jgi:hypothetical protein